MYSILFVCTGNTCRSNMAEAILKNEIEKSGDLKGKVIVSSAGIAAYDGDCASANSIKVLKERHGILINHSARRLSKEMLDKADIILTMSMSHKTFILNNCPEIEHKVFTLKEYVDDSLNISKNIDIEDPFMGDENVYEKCSMEIKEAVKKLITKLKGDF